MSCEQFDELLAFNSIEPIGSERMTWAIAAGFAATVNMWSTNGKCEPWQFVPGATEPKPQEVTPAALNSMLGLMANGNNR